MGKSIAATEAVRNLCGLLSAIRFKGKTYIIKRRGNPIASIGPVRAANALKTLKELKGILDELPRIGDDLDSFEGNLIEVLKVQPSLPDNGPWQ